jgi:hypothetical protein
VGKGWWPVIYIYIYRHTHTQPTTLSADMCSLVTSTHCFSPPPFSYFPHGPSLAGPHNSLLSRMSSHLYSLRNCCLVVFLNLVSVDIRRFCGSSWPGTTSAKVSHELFSSSSSLARQPYVDPGLPQKLLPAKVSGYCFFRFCDKSFPGWGCQPHAQPPATLEGRCSLLGLSPLAD